MLSDEFRSLDRDDMFGLIRRFPDQMEEALELGRSMTLPGDFRSPSRLALAGMGGSAIAGDFLALLVSRDSDIPISVTRNYRLPPSVHSGTLVILLSYSGNTEETLSCFDEAVEKNAQVAGITSGGALKENLEARDGKVVTIPGGYPPRASLGYLLIPGLILVQRLGIISVDMEGEISRSVNHLRTWQDRFSLPDTENPAYAIARAIHNRIPLIYGAEEATSTVALRWRTQLEENGKIVAFHHSLPELDHNEIVGFENNPDLLKTMSIVWLADADDHPRVRRRRKLTRDIIGDRIDSQITVESRGETRMERLFYSVNLGDWVSFWVAMLNGTNPTPVVKIDRLKKLLSG